MIDIDHVSFQYSGAEQENLQDFNLQIKKGECVVLTGESGCGKTCVTRLINTLIPHFYEGEMSGAVLIDGVDTRTIQPHDLSDKIGSVFQNPRSQFFSLDTDSEIVFGMENKGMPYQVMLNRYQQTIRELHIEKLKDRNLFDLSGGQKQTIAFASVYALNPDIFVLDEPSSNLDRSCSGPTASSPTRTTRRRPFSFPPSTPRRWPRITTSCSATSRRTSRPASR